MNSTQPNTTTSGITNKQLAILATLTYIMYLFVLPKEMHADKWFWINWTKYMSEHGLRNVYSGPTDYLPLFHYVLWIYTKAQGSVENVVSNIYILKGISLIMDFLGAGLVVYLVKDVSKKWFYFFLLILNPLFIYNSYLWGQVDAYHSFFLLAACVAAVRGRIIWMMIAYLIAINFKLHSIVYLPVLGLLLLPWLNQKEIWKKLLTGLAIIVVIQCMIVYPFWSVGDLPKLINVVFQSVDHYPKLSLNAFNIWYWAVDEDPELVFDTIQFAGIAAKTWGFIFFFSASFVLLFPLLILNIRQLLKKVNISWSDQYLDIILLTGALVTMNFFFFCTQMHERYCHVSMIFTCAYCFRNQKWHWLGLYFFAYFLNMERVFPYLAWSNYKTLIFQPRFISVIWAIFMLGFYKEYFILIFQRMKALKDHA